MFSFAANPETMKPRRDPAKTKAIGNLMFDPRVRRGTTVERSTQAASSGDAEAAATAKANAWTLRRRRPARQREPDAFAARPGVARGRPAADLTAFLTEQDGPTACPPATLDVDTQTDEFLEFKEAEADVPTVGPKRGVDAEAQVEPGELFDFDAESAPLVDVLATKTLEQALLELEEEAELDALFKSGHHLAGRKAAESEREAAMAKEASRLRTEAQERMQRARVRRRQEDTCRAKVIAAAVGRAAARAALESASGFLSACRLFADPVLSEVEAGVAGPLVDAARASVAARRTARRLVDDLLRAALARGQRAHREEAEARRKAAEEEAERRRPYLVSVVLRGVMPPRDEDEDEDEEEGEGAVEDEDAVEDEGEGEGEGAAGRRRPAPLPLPGTAVETTLGPVTIARADTAAQVEARIHAWIRSHPTPLVDALMRGRRLRLAHSGKPLEPRRTLDSLSPEDLRSLHLVNEPA
ncbi:hypothetical protein FNF29_06830 [Cafeteria roenbergensis]|uniref:Uncharacterized protein n=1 Tax=Cafeteria roenbergensis TaxID=33653 RepID=A0A5A8C8J8_CAFRO|nr:hypothetical protein FNF29_06830 [Cafeteria roenbergensis]|eukprot:KAA0148171.1 hypothetical protein FNF29_06830 [Cafeteria roenbergensis]